MLGTDECFSISGNSTEVEAPPAAVWPPDQTSPKNHEVPTVAQGRLTCSDLFYFDLLEPVEKENERFNAHCKNLYTQKGSPRLIWHCSHYGLWPNSDEIYNGEDILYKIIQIS